MSGEVVAAYGRQYLVDCGPDGLLLCVPRGKKSLYACGDRVSVQSTGPGGGVIEFSAPRTTEFFRSAVHRTKLIAANATQVAIICATDPSFGDEVIARVLVAAEHQGMKALVVLNKCDLADKLDAALERLAPFSEAGYRVITLSAKQDVTPLTEALEGEVTVLVGQSGMGKTTLLNALVPEANRATREISTFLASGKHTTTHARLIAVAAYRPSLVELSLAAASLALLGLLLLLFFKFFPAVSIWEVSEGRVLQEAQAKVVIPAPPASTSGKPRHWGFR